MENLHKHLRFPLIVAGYSANLISRYDSIVARLEVLDNRLKQMNSELDISNMWSVNCSRGRMIFHVTAQCADKWLKSELLSIFEMTETRENMASHYNWKIAPKLSASSILFVVDQEGLST